MPWTSCWKRKTRPVSERRFFGSRGRSSREEMWEVLIFSKGPENTMDRQRLCFDVRGGMVIAPLFLSAFAPAASVF